MLEIIFFFFLRELEIIFKSHKNVFQFYVGLVDLFVVVVMVVVEYLWKPLTKSISNFNLLPRFFFPVFY